MSEYFKSERDIFGVPTLIEPISNVNESKHIKLIEDFLKNNEGKSIKIQLSIDDAYINGDIKLDNLQALAILKYKSPIQIYN